jgi:thiamine-phosphate pyrophosphorylase
MNPTPWTLYITDRKSSGLPLLACIQRAIEAGIDLIQIREKDLPAQELFWLALKAREMAEGCCTRILVNDRLDIALAAGLDGVRLGGSSLPAHGIRSALPHQDFLIGVSTHTVDEVVIAAGQGATFVTFGPVFFTPSKAVYGVPRGSEMLREAAQSASIPVVALGGITAKNFRMCLDQGAAGIAAIRLFQDPACDLNELVRKIKLAV